MSIGTGLVNLGAQVGDFVCVYCPNNDHNALAQVACYATATCIVGCYYTNTLRELRHYVEDTHCRFIICCDANLKIAQQVADEFEFIKVRTLKLTYMYDG